LQARKMETFMVFGEILEQPIMGYGLGRRITKFAAPIGGRIIVEGETTFMHNSYLFFWHKTGLIGLLIFLLFLKNLFRQSWRLACDTVDPRYKGLAIGFFFSLIGIAIMSFTTSKFADATTTLFLGTFTLLNLAVGLFFPAFDANIWWIDLGCSQRWLEKVALLGVAVALLAFAILRDNRPGIRFVLAGVLVAACIVTAVNSANYLFLLGNGRLHSGLGLPFSLVFTVLLAVCAFCAVKRRVQGHRLALPWPVLMLAFALALAFPLAQMVFFGSTDYRRSADVIVVFGARAYADGTCSTALADRVRTACELYHQGHAPRLLFSGGPGDGDVHETEAMRRLAIRLGVPNHVILCDDAGLNTEATVRETMVVLRDRRWRRVLAVSHAFHLPRIKMTFHRAGQEVFTVPARERYVLTQMPYLMAREVAAFWVYYGTTARILECNHR